MTPTFTELVVFDPNTGIYLPQAPLIIDADGNLIGTGAGSNANGLGTIFEVPYTGGGSYGTATMLAPLGGPSGVFTFTSGLIADAGGDLFGETSAGGVSGDGTVFELAKTADGYASTPTTLASFSGTNGQFPLGGLVADAAGDVFGTTTLGGTNNLGTVFEIPYVDGSYASTPITLASFGGSNGVMPAAGLICDATGDLFGMTAGQFFGDGSVIGATVFEIPYVNGAYASAPTTLVTFSSPINLAFDTAPGLIADATGDLFGTTEGTVFEIVKTGSGYASTPATLVSFEGANGSASFSSPIMDAAGDLFGTTSAGGADNLGTVFEIAKNFTGYASVPITLLTFDNANGEFPVESLAVDAAGNLFGTTLGLEGADFSDGSIFELSNAGFELTNSAPPHLFNLGNNTIYSPDGASVVVAADLEVVNANSGTLAGATISIGAGFLIGDALNFSNQAGIAGTYDGNTGVLTLTGSASLLAYQTALESITFSSNLNDPSNSGTDPDRTIIWTITNGTQSSDPISSTILVSPVTVSVQTANGIDLGWSTLYSELANSPIGSGGTATQYTCVDSGAFNGQSAAIKFIVTGTGFTYSGSAPDIQLTGGTITGLQEEDTSNDVLATIAGLSISATAFQAAIATYVAGGANLNTTALNAIFQALAYQITGGAGSDTIQGGNISNMIYGSTGNDTIAGGAGTTTLDYSALSTLGIQAYYTGSNNGIANTAVLKGGANGTDTVSGTENIVDNGTGRTNGDIFIVDASQTVTANNGSFNYLLEVSASVNLVYGTNFTGISEFAADSGSNTIDFSADSSMAYVFGSSGDDTLTLGSGGGYLIGEAGANILTGGANAFDEFIGGDGGSDTMNGGGGTADNYYYADGNDQINGAGAFNAVVELTVGVTVQLGSAQYQDVQEFVSNVGNNSVTVANTDVGFKYLYGNAGDDTLSTGSGGGYLIGEGGTNVLTGGDGTNVFVADGASGIDTMNGGSGSNIYFIDSHSTVHGSGTFNTVIELEQNASLTLGSAQLGTDVQQVVLNGGTNSVDFSSATSSVYLYGNSGSDTLTGGTGNDFLYGEGGANTFAFQAGWGHDAIMDWTSGANNQIDLTALASLGVHAVTDLTQTITGGNDVITSSHTGSNSITLMGVGAALTAGSFHFS